MNIRFASENDLAALTRFNSRIKTGGRIDQIPMSPELPGEARYRPDGFPLYRKLMIAEDGQEVRAAMLLCHHEIFIQGKSHPFCWTKLPLSEGIVNPKYAIAILQLMKKALDHQPFLMGLGAGAATSEGHQFFVKLRWRSQSIPFFFYPVRVHAVLLGLEYFKQSPKLRIGSRLAAYLGAGLGASAALALQRKASKSLKGYSSEFLESFDGWTDAIFSRSLPEYPVALRSDATTLNIVYPPDDRRFARIRVKNGSGQKDLGWVVVATKQMQGNHYFGNLRVGTLVDGFGQAEHVPSLIAAGIEHLAEIGVDLVVANFSHEVWRRACKSAGMLSGPSNFHIFVAPKVSPLLEAPYPLHTLHVARGHSDGMDNLL